MISSMKSSWNSRAKSSSSTKHTVNDASTAHGEFYREGERVEPPRSFTDSGGSENDKVSQDIYRSDRQPIDAKRESSEPPKFSEHVSQDKDQVREGPQQTAKMSHSSGSARMYQAHKDAEKPVYSSSTSRTLKPAPYEGEVLAESDDSPRLPPGYRKYKYSGAAREITSPSEVTSASQTAELSKRYEALSREYEFLRGEHKAKLRRLEEKESWLKSLEADFFSLQRRYEEQSSALASTRNDLRSCQSQLDNVQRFISTADKHADQDIIQTLQGLNEEVYKISMTMADYVTEGFARQSATAREMREHIPVGESVLRTIGQAMVHHLAAAGNEDVALFLQIAFQGYISHLLCYVLSSWTIDQGLDALIEGTYQKLRKEETQAICGRWRALTRAHILPTFVSDPKVPVDYALAGLSDIVMATGLVFSQSDAASRLSSEFGEKILSIMSHAGRFANMVSEMISGDYEVFTVPPGERFDGKSMIDMDEDGMTSRRTGATQTVLCMSRLGLKKQMGEKTTMLVRAQVVLRSFLD